MMATTHALVGVVFDAAVWVLAPEAGMLPALATALGGLFPDFDLYAGHRKTLHFPVYFGALAVPAIAAVALNPTTTTLTITLFFATVTLHSVSDVFDGDPELKSWPGASGHTAYNHWSDRWLAPKRLIHYDDASEDLALTLAFAVPPVFTFDGLTETFVINAVAAPGVYVLLRKPMVAIAEAAVAAMPGHVVDLTPEWFVRDLR